MIRPISAILDKACVSLIAMIEAHEVITVVTLHPNRSMGSRDRISESIVISI